MHMLQDWIKFHRLDTDLIEDILRSSDVDFMFSGDFRAETPVGVVGPYPELESQDVAFHTIVIPALSSGFLDERRAVRELSRVQFAALPSSADVGPHTVDNGKGESPTIAMGWSGTIDDLVCLAHEAAHALQILMSDHDLMPPVAREACAFLGEILLIRYARSDNSELLPSLIDVWNKENTAYLGTDFDALIAGLLAPETPYTYRHNYPIARLASVELSRFSDASGLERLFASGGSAMPLLRLNKMANKAGDVANYLPPMPAAETGRPSVDVYRSLGAIALLDIDFFRGESETSIEAYFATLLEHFQAKTAYVALDENQKPFGYATWLPSKGDNTVMLTRQAAPFGNHLSFQKSLEQHLKLSTGVVAKHIRSARVVQNAW